MDMAVINAAMQTPNVQAGGMPQALGADGGLQGLFAMLFGMLLGQADAEGALEDPVLGTMLSSMKDGEADDTQLRLAMEMMAGMLAAPQATEWLSAQTDTAAADGIVQAAGAQNLLLQQLQARFAPAEQQVQTQADEDVRGTDWDALLQTLETAWETKADGQDPSAGLAREMDRMQFASAVRQVRELMSEKPRAVRDQTNRPLDVEALQAAVDSRQYVPETVSARSEAPALHEIADQLKTGILDNLRQGKNEFVVKRDLAAHCYLQHRGGQNDRRRGERAAKRAAASARTGAGDCYRARGAGKRGGGHAGGRPGRTAVRVALPEPAAGRRHARG